MTNKTILMTSLIAMTFILGFSVYEAYGLTTGYVNSPSSNSVDWANAVNGIGGTIVTLDFNAHPVGALQGNFYASQGVTLSTTGPFTQVQFGAGPGQGNTGNAQPGEGLHPASNFLLGTAGAKTLTVTFDSPVCGAGLFTLDYFDFNPNDLMNIEAFDGPSGTGTSLGSFNSVDQNFQQNNLYFMGLTDDTNSIRSLVYGYSGTFTGDILGIDDIKFATCGPSIDKFYTHTNNNWDPVCDGTIDDLGQCIDPTGQIIDFRLANINTEDVFADKLDQDANGYVLYGDEKKTKTVVTPGQYIAVSVIDVFEEQDVTVQEDFGQCLDIGTINPNKVPGGIQVVLVDEFGSVHDIDDDLAAGIGGSIELTDTDATVHVENVPANSQLRVMAKFQPNDDLGMVGLSCENFENLLDNEDPPNIIDSASAILTVVPKE